MKSHRLTDDLKSAIALGELPKVREILEQQIPPLRDHELHELLNSQVFVSPAAMMYAKKKYLFSAVPFAILNKQTAVAGYLLNHRKVLLGLPQSSRGYSELDAALLADDEEMTLRLLVEKNAVSLRDKNINKKSKSYTLYLNILKLREAMKDQALLPDGEYEFLIANAYYQIKDYDNAVKWYLDAIKTPHKEAKIQLARLYKEHNDKLTIYKTEYPLQAAVSLLMKYLAAPKDRKSALSDLEAIANLEIKEDKAENSDDVREAV